MNGYVYFLVVPDEQIEEVTNPAKGAEDLFYNYNLVATFHQPTDEAFYKQLQEKKEIKEVVTNFDDGVTISYLDSGFIQTKAQIRGNYKTSNTVVSFITYYIALILIATAATILAVQQLSDAEKYKYHYQLLGKLGVEKAKIDELIWTQVFLYFMLPFIIPLLLGFTITILLYGIFSMVVTLSATIYQFLISTFFLLFIYFVYLITTYVQFKQSIEKEE